MTADRIRVLCVDDHPIVTEGISSIINRQPDMVVVASADSVDGAIQQFRSERPDVTLMDLQLRDDNGVDAIHVIHEESPDARIVVLTVHQGDEDIFRALEAGAVAYLLKEEVPDDLVRIIRQVYSGEVPPMRPDLKERLAKRGTTPVLTAREIQVLRNWFHKGCATRRSRRCSVSAMRPRASTSRTFSPSWKSTIEAPRSTSACGEASSIWATSCRPSYFGPSPLRFACIVGSRTSPGTTSTFRKEYRS